MYMLQDPVFRIMARHSPRTSHLTRIAEFPASRKSSHSNAYGHARRHAGLRLTRKNLFTFRRSYHPCILAIQIESTQPERAQAEPFSRRSWINRLNKLLISSRHHSTTPCYSTSKQWLAQKSPHRSSESSCGMLIAGQKPRCGAGLFS